MSIIQQSNFDKLMQDNQAIEIRNLLMQIQSEEVSEAENKLANFAKDENFFSIVFSIITSSNEQQWLKTVAASYLNSTLVAQIQSQALQKSSQILKQVLYNPSIKQLDKRCFQKSIIKLIERGGQQIHRQWQELIKVFLNNKDNFDSAYLVMACFAVADQVPYAILRGIIQVCFEPILTSLEVCVENANLLNEMVKMWIVAFDSLRREQQNNQTLHFMSNSQRLLDFIDMLYDFQSVDNVIVCLNPNYFELNLLKYEAAELNKRLLLFSVNEQIKCSILQQYTKKNFAKFARTIHIMSLQQSFIETLGCEDLLTTLISLQQLYIVISPQHLNLQGAISVLQNEIFPFLPANDEQRQKFEQSPQQFNSLAEDCCDRQTYGILKTQSIKLLETIGDKIEGCLQYVLARAIQSIKVNLGFVSNYSGQYPVLQIQTAFLVVSVFSYGISKFQAQISSIKVILCDNRVRQLPPLQMSRVFTFLAYNYQQIYKNPSEGQSWIGYALSYNAHPTTAYCAYDFLSNNVDDHFNEVYLQALINQITTSQISLIWDITTKIIQNHFIKFSIQGCTIFISKLFQRIKRQIIQIESKQKNDTLSLNNCIRQFTCILKTLKKQEMIADANKSQQILRSIWPIIDLYRPALQWDLQDQIVTVIINIIDAIPSIVPQIHPLVPQFIDIFKVNGYYQKIYLRFFNQFALKSNFHNDEKPLVQILVVLKNALLNSVQKVAIGVNGKCQGSQLQRATAGNILLILQNIIAIHGTSLVQSNYVEFFNEVGSLCLRLLPNIDQQAQRTSTGRIITSRTLNTLFLCHMHINTNCFYDYLARLKTEDLYHGHDTRVFALCVAKQIFRLTDFTAVLYLIEGLLQIVGKSTEKDEVLQTKKKGKGKAKLQNQIRKIGDMDKLLKNIDSPFFGITTIGEQIINLFSSMNSANAQLVRNIIASLTPESLQILKKYVDLDSLGKKRRVIVKVVGLKGTQGASNNIDIQHQNRTKKENKIIEQEDEDNLDNDGPKRIRNKIKMQGKKKTKTAARKILPNQP